MQGWFLLYCKGRKEALARTHLELRGVSCFLPELQVEKLKRGKPVMETQLLFPNYLFVRFDPFITSVQSIRSTPGVSSLVRTNGQILPVETAIVVALRQRLHQQQVQETELPQAGDRVTITDGPFVDLEAIYAEPDGKRRSLLMLEMMGQQQRLSVDNLSFKRS
ncbi:transcription/translation regulatory transformer protein RfaH [Ferrimonas pelagia]|uniref:Transcription antitermination protein RfaH n=1 Tax=Ferrimonas pelagia TaxID=1177826 RepID=A0ABP9ENJ7_9GAMM